MTTAAPTAETLPAPRGTGVSALHPALLDASWVVPLAAVVFFRTAGDGVLLALLGVAEVLPLVLRRRAPFTTVALVFAAWSARWSVWAATGAGTSDPVLADVALLVALYSVAAHGARWARWAALGGAAVGAAMASVSFAVSLWSSPAELWRDVSSFEGLLVIGGFGGLLFTSGFAFTVALAAWAAGRVRRDHLAQRAAAAESARRALAVSEQRALVAAGEERARIARELHDVVAHSLAVVVAQADGGRYAAADDPDAATTALETISATGRGAMGDMRRLLGVLREGGDAPGTAARPAPQPGATDLADLVASVRASGLDVTLTQEGQARALPTGAGLALYRGAQEALTNVLKHAGPGSHAHVRLVWGREHVEVAVEDDGHDRTSTAPTDGDGLERGLIGMRERAAMFEGRVDAGPMPGGGFGVRLRLPLETAPAPGAQTPPSPDAARGDDPR